MDNASNNDTAIGFLKKKLLSWGASSVRMKFLHMRCITHILNLIVNDGSKESSFNVRKVREAVRYTRNSLARLKKFRDLTYLVGIECKNSLTLDVPIRWNSTYIMLKTTCLYGKAFESYEKSESSFRADLG